MKALFVITLAMIFLMVLAVPVFADQPENPGLVGQELSREAQDDDVPGASVEIHYLQGVAEDDDTNLGQLLKSSFGSQFGIPPKHIP